MNMPYYTITVTRTDMGEVRKPRHFVGERVVTEPVTKTLYVQHVEMLDIAALVGVVNTISDAPTRMKAVK